MKAFVLYSITVIFSCISVNAFSQVHSGRVLDVKGTPVDYATVVLLKAGEQAATAITDTTGHFSLLAGEGKYNLRIQNIAYKALDAELNIKGESSDLGVFRMEEALINMNEVVVTASPITRETDRFVMRISDNLPTFMNKDVSEVLQLAPGVWVDDNGISINGMSGAKVFINDRELKLSSSELINYLRNYRSTDIARVEVIPQAGAEYSADSKGGIIRIILRERQENGMNGSVSLQTSQGEYYRNYRPSATINALVGKWALNAALAGDISPKSKYEMTENRLYHDSENFFLSRNTSNSNPASITGRLGAIYEIDDKNSIGAELEWRSKDVNSPSFSETEGETENLTVRSTSDYRQKEKDRNGSATLNYHHKIDTTGSTVKVILDYINNKVTGDNDYHSMFETSYGKLDSVYRSKSTSHYRIYTGDIQLDKRMGNGMKYTAGVRFSRNRMSDQTFYEGQYNSQWQPIDRFNYALDYTENISAAYGTFAFSLGRMDVLAGIRGEYTRTIGKDSYSKDYTDLFPNLNLTYSFNAMKTFMLIGQYARNIERPNFWYLNPNRTQFSDYSYMVGNPLLRPTYINRMSLTAVYNYRHTLTVGANLHRDLIREVTKVDPDNNEVKYVIPENHYMENHYFVAISSPLNILKWFSLNTNLVGVRQDIHSEKAGNVMTHYLYFINTTANFTLPAEFFLELTYSGTSRLYSANSGVEPSHMFHAQIKRKLFGDRVNLSVGVHNIFDRKTAYFANMEDYTATSTIRGTRNSRQARISLQYLFNSGKAFKKRTIESHSDTEKERLKRSSEAK